MSSRVSASTSPARSVTATRECVAPRSAASTTPASRLNANVRGGRPPRDAPGSAGTTSCRVSSESTRWATVERDSPVRATNSACVRACPSRIRRSIAPAPLGDVPAKPAICSVCQSGRTAARPSLRARRLNPMRSRSITWGNGDRQDQPRARTRSAGRRLLASDAGRRARARRILVALVLFVAISDLTPWLDALAPVYETIYNAALSARRCCASLAACSAAASASPGR